jgi:hypothetical protein
VQTGLERLDGRGGIFFRHFGEKFVMDYRHEHARPLRVHIGNRTHHAVGANALDRQVAMLGAGCRSFDDVVRAIRALRTL